MIVEATLRILKFNMMSRKSQFVTIHQETQRTLKKLRFRFLLGQHTKPMETHKDLVQRELGTGTEMVTEVEVA